MDPDHNQDNSYPQEEELEAQIAGRHRRGLLWRSSFTAATILAIIVLMVLIVTIVNESFGLAAVQNEIPPSVLINDYHAGRILGATNVTASENDTALAQRIGSAPEAIGLLGYAYYNANEEALKVLNIEGVPPSAETAASGEYPLTRPLYIYTTAEILDEKPQVAAFVTFYLERVNTLVEQVGYFPEDAEALEEAVGKLTEALGTESLPEFNPADYSGEIIIIGSSTVFPVTTAAAELFQEQGFSQEIAIESTGTGGGFELFCVENAPDVDIVNASRPISNVELEACRANGRDPIEIQIGTDALAVVVNAGNDFVDNINFEALDQLLTSATTWSDVNPAWPSTEIQRYVPTASSGTMNFFIDEVYEQDLAALPKEALVDILAANISRGLGRRLEREQLFYEDRLVFEDPVLFNELCAGEEPPAACIEPIRTQEEVLQLVEERVVVPTVVDSWFLIDSLLNRSEIILEAQQKYPDAEVEFYAWLKPEFLTDPQSSQPELAGVRTAILGTLWVIAITIAFSFPLGVGAAVYLEEYADQTKWYNQIIQTNINNLAGVPSIIYGMLGLAVFVRALEPISSGALLGVVDDATTANGRTILAAGLTLGLLILPIIIISAQEAIRAVPGSLRQASYGLGATKWQTIWYHVLPNALPGIMTGTILAMSRAIGETAPLVVIGVSTFITADPTGPFSKFTVLPIQIYQWTTRPQGAFRNIAGAAIIILLFLLVTMNATAVILRNRSSKKYA